MGRSFLHAFFPSFAYLSNEFRFVFLHQPHQHLVFCLFMSARPEHHFRQHWRQVDPLLCELINQLSCVLRVDFRSYDTVSFQISQPVRQNIGCNSFVRSEEFLVRAKSPQHHVPDNQQRPAVSQYLDGCVQWTPRAPLGVCLYLCHFLTLTI
jgi:hypothetical protein